jgi:hypothetical protein
LGHVLVSSLFEVEVLNQLSQDWVKVVKFKRCLNSTKFLYFKFTNEDLLAPSKVKFKKVGFYS